MSVRIWAVYVTDAEREELQVDDCDSKEEADETAERHRASAQPGESVEIYEHEVHLISRSDAAQKLRTSWLETMSREELLAAHEPEWTRLRNYEIERELDEEFGRVWVINEWCPFDGIYCEWTRRAPDEVIDRQIRKVDAAAAELRTNGYSPERMIDYLRRRGATQSKGGGA